MQTRVEEITPQMAESYLNKMTKNRPLSNSVVTKYAGMMRKGQWLLTHQGIAFNDAGELIDGQHRLWAIIEAGVSVSLMVTRGIPATVEHKGMTLASMDGIDMMRARNTSDQLALSHDVSNPRQVNAAFIVIAQIVGGAKFSTVTVPQAVAMLPIYGKDADVIICELKTFKPVRVSAVAGVLAFARNVFQEEVDNFAMALTTGAGLKPGDAALVLRNRLINQGMNGSSSTLVARLEGARMVANALMKHIDGKSMQVLLPSEEGLNAIRNKQKPHVQKIRNILGVHETKS